MAAFTTVLTTTADVDSSIILSYDQAFLIANGQNENLSQIATYRQRIGAKSITIPRYARLPLATTPLVETDDVVSTVMVDAGIVMTPKEYGQVVTTTNLANLQSGGTADLAAAQLVGMSAGATRDALAIMALEASTNRFGVADASIVGTDIATRAFLATAYNKLARANVPKINGAYIAIMHDDVIGDLRSDTTAGSWLSVNQYNNPQAVLQNEVGMIGGFRILTHNSAVTADEGAGAVDVYSSYFLGYNGLGLAESQPMKLVITGPFDKLSRFVNFGFIGTFEYKIVDQDAVWVGRSASSVGTNV